MRMMHCFYCCSCAAMSCDALGAVEKRRGRGRSSVSLSLWAHLAFPPLCQKKYATI